jgi:hypothetical protein
LEAQRLLKMDVDKGKNDELNNETNWSIKPFCLTLFEQANQAGEVWSHREMPYCVARRAKKKHNLRSTVNINIDEA